MIENTDTRKFVKKLLTKASILCLSCLPLYGWAAAPYPQSPVIADITFDMSTLKTQAPGSDNWAITWADDGHQYTTWGDGGGFGGTNDNGRVSVGYGRVEGIKDSYTTANVWGGLNSSNPATFTGKSLGLISIDGTIYTWRNGTASELGAFEQTELYVSTNHLATLEYTGVRFTPDDFPNSLGFFSPTFLQFGQDYQGARDNYVYVYGNENKNNTWNVQTPGEIALMRVPKTGLTNKSNYEYFAGMNGDTPQWTANPAERIPVFSDPTNGIMRTSVSYNAGLNRYFLITQQVDRYQSNNGHIGIYDAPEPWGPWTTVKFANAWDIGLQHGAKSVYWNFSNKWLSQDGKNFVLVYTDSDNWATVEGSFVLRTDLTLPSAPTGLNVTVTPPQ
jgi:hypothetical protein